jgi:hypothetical protein
MRLDSDEETDPSPAAIMAVVRGQGLERVVARAGKRSAKNSIGSTPPMPTSAMQLAPGG